MAGKHGEGLKAAAAVLMRENCRLELHQSHLALAFTANIESGALCSFVRKGHTATAEEPRVPQIGLLLRMLKLELNVSRGSDVITVIRGLSKFVALDKYFLQRSHQAVCDRSQLAQPRQYLRLSAGKYGALLWPTASSGAQAAEESVAKRVFVAGIFWERKPSQKHYGVDFTSSVSSNCDRTNIHHPRYQKYMARIVDHLLKGPEDVVELLLPVLLLELEQAEEDAHHLHRLPEFISPPSYVRLLAAFRRKLVPPQRFLSPRTGEKRKELEHCAVKDNFYVTSPLLYKLFTERGDFPDLATMKTTSWQALRASRPVRPGTALADAERKLREAAVSVLEISVEQARRLELRDTEGHVLDCKWSKEDGKLLVASSRLPNQLGGKWKLLKAIRSQIKAMEKSLRENESPARSLTSGAAPAQTTSSTSSLISAGPSSSSSSPSPSLAPVSSASSSTFSRGPSTISNISAERDHDDNYEDDDDVDDEDDVITLGTNMGMEHQAADEDEGVEEAGVDTTQQQQTTPDNAPTKTALATISDHAVLPEGNDGGDWAEALTGGQAPASRDAPRDAHCATLADRTMRVQYRPLDDDDQVVDCTERGFERLRKAPKPQLVEILAGIRAIVDSLGHPVAPAVCCVEYEFEAVFAPQSSSYSVNLWPLLHRAYTRRELFAHLVVLLSHEVAHLYVPQAGHGAQHGRMTEDLVARVLLKSDLVWTRESLAPGIPPPACAQTPCPPGSPTGTAAAAALVATGTAEDEDEEPPAQRRRRVTEPGPRLGSLVSGATAASPAPQPAPGVGDKRKRG
jgi:hypothetical protein